MYAGRSQHWGCHKGATYASFEPDMSQLLLAVYHSEDTAEHVLGVLRAQGDELTASLESAAVVKRQRDCTLTVIRTEQPRSAAFWGVFWEAFFGLCFRVPDPAPAASSNLGQFF